MLPSELFKTATMSSLAEQAVKLGVCSSCRKKMLRFIYSCEHFSSWQCTNCLHVFILARLDDENQRLREQMGLPPR